ncbi:stand still [Cochliomyia hominivorax]
MNHMESQDSSSNDDTNLISELLNTAEAMQTSSLATTNNSLIANNQLQQKCEQIQQSFTHEISATTFCETNNTKLIMPLPSTQSNSVNSGNSALMNTTQYNDSEDSNQIHNIRHVHIPYILNGELYQIQTQDGENVTVKCCHCPPDRVYRGSVRSTGNFHMHIKRRHPDLLEKLHDMKVTALLERRDRLMRNRKISHRHNRNRQISVMGPTNGLCSFKNEEKSEVIQTTDPELSLMHTHKLKIKTVFQRHQMQQREAAEMRNWSNTEYVVMPIDKLPTNGEQPINYSLKSVEQTVMQTSFNTDPTNNDHLQQQQQQEKNKSNECSNQASFNNYTNFNNQPTTIASTHNTQNEYNIENSTLHRHLSTPSISLSCPSILSSYSSSQPQYDMENNHRSYQSLPLHLHNLSIIKPEHLSLGGDTEAIDLTLHTDSGIFSNSEDDSTSIQHNETENSTHTNGAGSQKTNSPNNITIDCERNVGEGVHHMNNSNNNMNNVKWHELLMQVENSLRDIQREMNVRNQIESNRMFLDIAKFKFLNPGFQFNW